MFTWTSRLAALALVSACATSVPQPDRAQIRVEGTRVTIVAPNNFCVDRQSVDLTKAGGLVLFTHCAVQGIWSGPVEISTAILSVSISNDGLNGSLEDLRQFLTTAPGKVALGRGGKVESIKILDSKIIEDVLLIKLRDTAVKPVHGQHPDLWRGFFVVAGRVVSASVIRTSDNSTSDAQAQQLLVQMATSSRQANR